MRHKEALNRFRRRDVGSIIDLSRIFTTLCCIFCKRYVKESGQIYKKPSIHVKNHIDRPSVSD